MAHLIKKGLGNLNTKKIIAAEILVPQVTSGPVKSVMSYKPLQYFPLVSANHVCIKNGKIAGRVRVVLYYWIGA